MNKGIVESLFPGTKALVDRGFCPVCKNPIGEFNYALSLKEFGISGLCQQCQDKVFGEEF